MLKICGMVEDKDAGTQDGEGQFQSSLVPVRGTEAQTAQDRCLSGQGFPYQWVGLCSCVPWAGQDQTFNIRVQALWSCTTSESDLPAA